MPCAADRSIRVYSRPGCHLCEQLVEQLLPQVRGMLEVEVVDINSSARWLDDFGSRIPVVEYDGRIVCQYFLDTARIDRILATISKS